MGHAAARSRLPRGVSGVVQSSNSALPLAALSADVSIRGGEADESRPLVAKFGRAQLSLLDAAVANATRLVHGTTAALVPALLNRSRAPDRAPDSVSDFRAAPLAARRRRMHPVSPGAHLCHRQLHVFQPADHGVVPVSLR